MSQAFQKYELRSRLILSSQQLSATYGLNLMNAKEFKRYHKIEQQTLNDVVTENKLSSIYSEIYSVLGTQDDFPTRISSY